jgi:hypothetical protein
LRSLENKIYNPKKSNLSQPFRMALPIQIIHVHYQGKILSLLDSDDITPLYTVHIPKEGFKISLSHAQPLLPSSPPPYSSTPQEANKPFATAIFPALSTLVTLVVHSRQIQLQREKTFNRTYLFTSAEGEALRWESDGMLSGDWKLVDGNNSVWARFRNKMFSTTELGSFEIVGKKGEGERDLIIVSGLAVLAMVQSTLLAALVATGGEY